MLTQDGIPSGLSRTTNAYLRDQWLIIKTLDEIEIKQLNHSTYLNQVQFFKTWSEKLVIKEPTLGTLIHMHKEHIFVSYALEISQRQNLKNLMRLYIKSVQNYPRVGGLSRNR